MHLQGAVTMLLPYPRGAQPHRILPLLLHHTLNTRILCGLVFASSSQILLLSSQSQQEHARCKLILNFSCKMQLYNFPELQQSRYWPAWSIAASEECNSIQIGSSRKKPMTSNLNMISILGKKTKPTDQQSNAEFRSRHNGFFHTHTHTHTYHRNNTVLCYMCAQLQR